MGRAKFLLRVSRHAPAHESVRLGRHHKRCMCNSRKKITSLPGTKVKILPWIGPYESTSASWKNVLAGLPQKAWKTG